jgi:hypothetical protein
METLGLKNVNLLTREQYDGVSVPAQDELWAVEVETYSNGTSWYRVYADGWCEQGGIMNGIDTGTSLTLIKPYKDTNYGGFVQQAVGTHATSYQCGEVSFVVVTNEKATLHTGVRAGVDVRWFAYGYIR